jgi:hypothetical protein
VELVKKLLVPMAFLALSPVVAAGCGGGGSSKNQAYAGSVRAYAAALDSICAPLEAKARSLGIHSIADIAVNGHRLEALIQRSENRIEKLQPPAQVKAAAADWKAKVSDALSKYGALISDAKAGDAAKVQQIANQIHADDVATNKDAHTIGADACAQGG